MKNTVINGLIAGVVMLIVGLLLSQGWNILFPALALEYQNGIFRPWSDPAMQIYFLYPFVLGLVLSYAWEKIIKVFPGKDRNKKVLDFTVFYWIIASIPGMFISYSSFPVSLLMVLTWSINGFFQVLAGGYILSQRNK